MTETEEGVESVGGQEELDKESPDSTEGVRGTGGMEEALDEEVCTP